MPGLACLSRWYSIPSLFVVVFVSLAAEESGQASTPVSIYTAASRVEMLPGDTTATEVVIHGAFMFVNSSGGYSDAVCGMMYFRCPAGSETMCRMQWLDIRNMGTGSTQCAGFGAQNVVSTAPVRTEGAALTSPDTWDLGIGVQAGIYIDGKCAPAKTLACAQAASSDGGTTDVSISPDTRLPIDSVALDLASSTETGTRETAGQESAIAIDGAVDRAANSSQVDSATPDVALEHDALAGRVLVDGSATTPDHQTSVPDAGADTSARAPDASPGTGNDGTSPKSEGCGCHVGGRPADPRSSFPAGLAIFAAVALPGLIRRKRR